MNETESNSQPQAATPSAPPQKPEVVKPPARRFSGFLAVAILVLFGGTMLLMLQALRAGNASEARIADIARDAAALNRQTEDLNARIAALERSSAETQSVSAQLADLDMRLAAAESNVSRAADRDTLAVLVGLSHPGIGIRALGVIAVIAACGGGVLTSHIRDWEGQLVRRNTPSR